MKQYIYIYMYVCMYLHSLEQAAGDIGLYMNADKTECMCFNQRSDISTLKGSSLKLVDKFTYFGSTITSTENDINMWLAKSWTAMVIWKSDLSHKIKCNFFHTAVVSLLLYGYTTRMLTKHIEKKLDSNCISMLKAILKKSWKQHPRKHSFFQAAVVLILQMNAPHGRWLREKAWW